ncbi:MAG TPA: hypothetical protein VGG64_19440, partial [Pirellulales bacterium]
MNGSSFGRVESVPAGSRFFQITVHPSKHGYAFFHDRVRNVFFVAICTHLPFETLEELVFGLRIIRSGLDSRRGPGLGVDFRSNVPEAGTSAL